MVVHTTQWILRNMKKPIFPRILKNYKMRNYNENFNFIAVSDWLKKEAQRSYVLKKFNINQIDNNIDISELSLIKKKKARFDLNINTKKTNHLLRCSKSPE